MSVSRKDWSALSSLARQRTLEDEEEQERERRRRHRNLSSTTEDESPGLTQNGDRRAAERLPSVEEAELPKPVPPAFPEEVEDIQTILRTRQERRQRRQAVEAAQAPIQERPEAEEGQDRAGPEQPPPPQPLVPKRGAEPLPRRRLSRERRGPWAREGEESAESQEPGAGKKGLLEKSSGSESSPVPEKSASPAARPAAEKGVAPEEVSPADGTAALEKRGGREKLVPGKASVSEKSLVSGKTSVSQKIEASEKKSSLEKKPSAERASASEKTPERRLVSEKASIFEKGPVSETKAAPKRAVITEQPQPPPRSQAATKEPRGRAVPGQSPASSAKPDPPAAASRLPPITLQVKIPSKEDEADPSSPTQLTYSSSLRRSSPRTISFRMSPRKDSSEAALTRSASVRLPASTVKLGEKLERYHTAIQRSESVRSPGSSRTEVFVTPVGVASKRHIFEKEIAGGQSRAEPASSRKENLRLSGVVTSRLNLWISRTQESGEQDPQEVRKELAATKRSQWGKKSDSSLDAEV
ncbi:ladinin-1 [Perognathus longimembris pacificus]|uniref:ladinin-1 n=1 Tax=Perognathus longimembris pacificus TaxID=214514 RepID=UPI002018F5CA|nr:ladinin-1 [Perognathus longimembris pacificus]